MPDMSLGQWLLVTLTSGVALMGQTRGKYTFFGHLKWTAVIMPGYAASIATHMWVNSSLF